MVKASDWLLDGTDIVAHIFFAVGTIDHVLVTTVCGAFVGTMSYPDGEGVLIRPPTLQGIPRAIPEGSSVCVEYTGHGDQYRFYTDVRSMEDNGVRINLPRAIERNDQRLTPRYTVPIGAGFRFRAIELPGEPEFSIHDISTGGVGLAQVSAPAPAPGRLIVGEIHLPGVDPISVCLEVRHVSEVSGHYAVGARITAITTYDRVRLAGYLVQCEQGS